MFDVVLSEETQRFVVLLARIEHILVDYGREVAALVVQNKVFEQRVDQLLILAPIGVGNAINVDGFSIPASIREESVCQEGAAASPERKALACILHQLELAVAQLPFAFADNPLGVGEQKPLVAAGSMRQLEDKFGSFGGEEIEVLDEQNAFAQQSFVFLGFVRESEML